MKRYIYFILILIIFCVAGCSSEEQEQEEKVCEHTNAEWIWEEGARCSRTNSMYLYCEECGEILEEKEEYKDHDYECVVVDPTCTERGYTIKTCKNCNYVYKTDYVSEKGHNIEYIIDKAASLTTSGMKHKKCKDCDLEDYSLKMTGSSLIGGIYV